jgi:hypothetical protein
MKKIKFYTFLNQEQREILSLNFLLAEKIIADTFVSDIAIKQTERKAESNFHHNREFFCLLFCKHISRYINDIDTYKFEKL